MRDLRALQRRRNRWKDVEILAGKAELRVGVARDIIERQIFEWRDAEFGRVCLIVVVVVGARLAGRQQFERGDRHRAGVVVVEVELVVVVFRPSAEAGAPVECAETAPFR